MRRRLWLIDRGRRMAIAALLLAGMAGGQVAVADPAADFFKGKTISILVGYEAGGGYDLYARLVAQFLGRHIPGQPTLIVQNMPGAGGLKAARYLLDVAAKDGTVLGIPSQTVPFDTVLGYSAGVDAGKFQWLGRFAMNVEIGAAYAKTGIATIEDLRGREISVGGTGGTASTSVIPFLLNKLAGTKFKIVAGYRSAYEVMLAMERNEMEMVGGIGLATVEVRFGKEIKDGSLRLIFQSGLGRHADIPNVPNIDEFGRTEEEKQMLGLFAASAAVGRSLVAPPGVPQERVEALRQAVAVTLADPELRTFAAEHNLMIEPGSAADVQGIVQKTLATPKELTDKTRAVLESMKAEK
jgi:tripartite-type tricarboxylate transporter receptor subunit TctC